MSARSKDTGLQLMQQLILASRGQRSHRSTAKQSLCVQCHTRRNLHQYTTSLPRFTPQWNASASTSDGSFPSQKARARTFSTSLPAAKKSSSSSKSRRSSPSLDTLTTHKDGPHIPDNKATRNKDAEVDPYDFTELDSGIAKAVARLKDSLVKTKDAGRVTPEMIEALDVEINVKAGETGKGGSPHKEKAKIGDLASVVAKGGRSVNIFCAEENHVKPITAALLASPYSLVPQTTAPHTPGTTSSAQSSALPRDANPLLITVPVPPVTAETRNLAKQQAKAMFERASNDVRNARGDMQKLFRKMELSKAVIPDELRKAHKQMDEVVKKGQAEVKRVYEASLKALEA